MADEQNNTLAVANRIANFNAFDAFMSWLDGKYGSDYGPVGGADDGSAGVSNPGKQFLTPAQRKLTRDVAEYLTNGVVVFAVVGLMLGMSTLTGSEVPTEALGWAVYALTFVTAMYLYFRTFWAKAAHNDALNIMRLTAEAEKHDKGHWKVNAYKFAALAYRLFMLAGIAYMGYAFAPGGSGGFDAVADFAPESSVFAAVTVALSSTVLLATLVVKWAEYYVESADRAASGESADEGQALGMGIANLLMAPVRWLRRTLFMYAPDSSFRSTLGMPTTESAAREEQQALTDAREADDDEGVGQTLSAEHRDEARRQNMIASGAHGLGIMNAMWNAGFAFALAYYVGGSDMFTAIIAAALGLMVSMFVTRFAALDVVTALADKTSRMRTNMQEHPGIFVTLILGFMAAGFVLSVGILNVNGMIENLVDGTDAGIMVPALASLMAVTAIAAIALYRTGNRPQMTGLFGVLAINSALLLGCYAGDAATAAMVTAIFGTVLMSSVTGLFLASKLVTAVYCDHEEAEEDLTEIEVDQKGYATSHAQCDHSGTVHAIQEANDDNRMLKTGNLLAFSGVFFFFVACFMSISAPGEDTVLEGAEPKDWGMEEEYFYTLVGVMVLFSAFFIYLAWKFGNTADIGKDVQMAQADRINRHEKGEVGYLTTCFTGFFDGCLGGDGDGRHDGGDRTRSGGVSLEGTGGGTGEHQRL